MGYLGMIIAGLIGYLITRTVTGILLGITYAILIINIMKQILFLIINDMAKKR